jgi:hypothetical protein
VPGWADAAWHEEAFYDAEDGGDSGPEEEKIDYTGGVAAEIEVVNAETAEEEREQDADDFVFAGTFVFGVEPGSLLIVHIRGVDGVDDLHDVVPRIMRDAKKDTRS